MERDSDFKIKIEYIFWYFVIFSVLGLFIETVFCYVTSGIFESRKGLLFGPFCPIYGLGGAVFIVFLQYCKKDSATLFVVGAIVGGAIEYVLSFIMEAMYASRFWDYTYSPLNLNGRTCIAFSLCWGVLAILLMKGIKPITDRIINKIPLKIRLKLEVALLIFLIFDLLATIWSINTYIDRVVYKRNIAIQQEHHTEELSAHIKLKIFIENKIFTNERMTLAFPNLRYRDEFGSEIFVRDKIN